MGLAVVAAVVLSGGGGKETQTITGTFTLFDIGGVIGGHESCSGDGGYSDIDAGMPVTVRDGDGTIVGGTSTRHSTRDELVASLTEEENSGVDEAEELLDGLEGSICTLRFEVEVDDADFYEVEVGNRGSLSYRKAELAERDWVVEFSLGN